MSIIGTITKKGEKLAKLANVEYEIRVIERSIKEMAHLAYEYRFSAMPDARKHYDECRTYLAVLRLKKALLEQEKSLI